MEEKTREISENEHKSEGESDERIKNIKNMLNRNKTKHNKKEKKIQELAQIEGECGVMNND